MNAPSESIFWSNKEFEDWLDSLIVEPRVAQVPPCCAEYMANIGADGFVMCPACFEAAGREYAEGENGS